LRAALCRLTISRNICAPDGEVKKMPISIFDDTGTPMVARNFRSPNRRGEIDLIGWHEDTLCFVEVKTRTTHDVKPAEAAVDREKRRDLLAVAREYLRHMPPSCPWRLEVISVYYDQPSGQPQIEVFRNVPS
jgi:putative endonuclease